MLDYIRKVFGQIVSFIHGLPAQKKTALVIVGILVLFGMTLIFRWAGQQTYQTMITNLSPEDSANIIRILREKRVPFRVDQGGKKIEVPPEYVHDLRLELASLGMPETSTAGYELFDSQNLGTTSYVQKVNFKRALEGELTRTIASLKGVERARVHLAIPKKSAFVEDQKEPTASVVIDLKPGARLHEKQIYGIGNLVASAVEGMDVNKVVVVNSHGKVLSDNKRDPLMALTADQLDYQRKLEEDLERRITSMLSPVVGDGKVVARVTAELDFSIVSQTQTLVDGDSAAILSTSKDTQTMNGQRPGPGVAGARANEPGAEPAEPPLVTSNTNKNRELTNFTVPKTVIQRRNPVGNINKLSVAVVVDGKEVRSKDENGQVLSKVEPWTPEQLAEFEKIVVSAAGIDPKRGDSIEIKNLEFSRADFAEAEKLVEEADRRSYIQNLIIYTVMGVIIILFFVFVIRPFIKWVTENTIDSVDSFLPQTIEELEKIQKNATLPGMEEIVPELPDKIDPEKVEGEMIKEKIITLVDANPHKAALILREWVRNEKASEKSDQKQA